MKHPILMIAAGLTLGSSAMAQYAPPGRGPDGNAFWRGAPESPRQRIQFLQDRINRGIGDGSLDRREARSALNELNNIRRMDARLHYDNDGCLPPPDRAAVQGRLDQLSQRLHWLRHTGY